MDAGSSPGPGPRPGSGEACVFLAPLRSGSRQSPDMGDLMATNVLVSLPQTRGLASSWQQPCAKPSLPWELWISPGYRDSAQRQWRGMPWGGVCGGTTTLSQRRPSGKGGWWPNILTVPSPVSARVPVGAPRPAQDQPAGSSPGSLHGSTVLLS